MSSKLQLDGRHHKSLVAPSGERLQLAGIGVVVGTSSCAVAKRPRDVSCLSVDIFNSIKPRAESFIDIIRYVWLQIHHSVQLNAVLLSLA